MKLKFQFYLIIFSIISIFSFIQNRSSAQIVPDNTLGSENSRIESIDELQSLIEGGAIRGENLFHSFEEFGIPEKMKVYFANPEQIKNIFSRITGDKISEILGTLGAEGNANLFLINPNGIVFGENAVVDVGGSFIATTAESIEFADGKILSISDRYSEPILTWNAPIGLGFNDNNASIKVKGAGNNLVLNGFSPTEEVSRSGLQVRPQRTLALIGGEITFSGSALYKESGTINLGSVNRGIVAISEDNSLWNFTPMGNTELSNILLSKESSIISTGKGKIDIFGRNISLSESSVILSQNQNPNSIESIIVKASESISIGGEAENSLIVSSIRSEAFDEGLGATIDISAKNLSLTEGGQIATQTFSPSNNIVGGDINIDVSQNIEIIGTLPTNPNILSIVSASSFGLGNAGNINIATNSVSLKTGGKINASALSGAGGEITLNSERLSLNNGMISASANEEGGNISLDASELSITNSSINAESLSQTGGNINIKSDRLQLFDSNLSASAGQSGNGGNITITADTVLGINSDITATAIKGDGGKIGITADGLLGFEERPADPNNGISDLDASSEFGTDGTITIINPQINTRDPLVDLAKLEPDLRENNLENRCDNQILERKQIIYTGRSNLSSNLSSEETYLPTPDFVPPQETMKEEDEEDFPIWQEGDPIIDSNAVRIDKRGELYFVAELSPQKARDLLCQSTTTNSQSD